MAMAENGGVVCKCSPRRSFRFRFRQPNLRNVSSIPLFKHALFTRSPSLAGKASTILSMSAQKKSSPLILSSSRHKRIPIYVMMPVDAFCIDGSGIPRIRRVKALTVSLKALKLAGVHGVAVEVWWGVVERFSPLAYDWSLYEQLFKLISESGLKVHVALSFHSNVNSSSSRYVGVSLPLWIMQIGVSNKHIFYRDKNGFSSDDYLTLGVDHLPLFCGRTALQCYEDFMTSFVKKFESHIGSVMEEICVGLGPSGELRYPAHFGDGKWKFPGIGEFQCYDQYMLDNLKMATCEEGKPQWGERGPPNAGCYNSMPSGVPFFEEGEENFLSDYGCFFLEWYSGCLLGHADAILAKAAKILKKYQEDKQASILLVAKIGGIYWWYQTVAHPAELTAGYYNTALRDGYDPVASLLSRHGAALHVSCFEMMDSETPASYLCSPEGLRQQDEDKSDKNKIIDSWQDQCHDYAGVVRFRSLARVEVVIWSASKKRIIHLTGRNTNERCDRVSLWQIHANCYHSQAEAVRSFTYFRMNDKIFRAENWSNFVPFVRKMSTSW